MSKDFRVFNTFLEIINPSQYAFLVFEHYFVAESFIAWLVESFLVDVTTLIDSFHLEKRARICVNVVVVVGGRIICL
jgi:hypothetical protein